MIKDKIISQVRKKFLQAIKSTKETEKEYEQPRQSTFSSRGNING